MEGSISEKHLGKRKRIFLFSTETSISQILDSVSSNLSLSNGPLYGNAIKQQLYTLRRKRTNNVL